eukprot:1940682-Amphidinium_carterae.2
MIGLVQSALECLLQSRPRAIQLLDALAISTSPCGRGQCVRSSRASVSASHTNTSYNDNARAGMNYGKGTSDLDLIQDLPYCLEPMHARRPIVLYS